MNPSQLQKNRYTRCMIAVWIGAAAMTGTTIEAFSSLHYSVRSCCCNTQLSLASDADLLQDLPFVPPQVMSKFMAAVGDPLTAGSLQAGYQAGAVSKDEMQEIQSKMKGMESIECQSIETIEKHWKAALEGQPWHVQSMGKLATNTIVPLVAKLQEKSVNQAKAMQWINEEALPILQQNSTIVELLSNNSKEDSDMLAFNNTRAKFESDRGVWSASMDVFLVTNDDNFQEQTELSQAGTALQALKDGMGDDGISSFDVNVLEDNLESTTNDATRTVGLVNAYFVPQDEIKILVVEIDDILHNVTWKGLD